MTSSLQKVPRLFACAGFFTALILLAPLASAQTDVEKLLDEKRCYACHQLREASLGPPWEAIAARHAPRKELMLEVLARKIVHGGGGNWGVVPMVPNQWVSLEEAHVMANWILSLGDKQ